jgi:hypothetical protein
MRPSRAASRSSPTKITTPASPVFRRPATLMCSAVVFLVSRFSLLILHSERLFKHDSGWRRWTYS